MPHGVHLLPLQLYVHGAQSDFSSRKFVQFHEAKSGIQCEENSEWHLKCSSIKKLIFLVVQFVFKNNHRLPFFFEGRGFTKCRIFEGQVETAHSSQRTY